jgi:hypothetical protein
MLRQYIPARLEDNPSMADDDPGYEGRLEGLGSAQLVKAMRHGDWNIVEGAFFDCWDTRRHEIRPFTVPAEWMRFRSGDWGSAKPFSFGWWALVPDLFKTPDGVWLPRGCMVRFAEWYGCKPGHANTGLKLHAEVVGEGLHQRETALGKCQYGVIDPAAFSEDGGPSIYERIRKGAAEAAADARRDGKPGGDVTISFRRADNARVPGRGAMGGWDQMRARLVGDDEGRRDGGVLLDVHRQHPHHSGAAARHVQARRPGHGRRGPRGGRLAVRLHVAPLDPQGERAPAAPQTLPAQAEAQERLGGIGGP